MSKTFLLDPGRNDQSVAVRAAGSYVIVETISRKDTMMIFWNEDECEQIAAALLKAAHAVRDEMALRSRNAADIRERVSAEADKAGAAP